MTTSEKTPNQVTAALQEKYGYSNIMEVPKLEKIVLNVGVGSVSDPAKISVIEDRLAKITGQKPAPRGARKSIASFKVREGDVIGYQVTLRGSRMYDFLNKLIKVALPRSKDFQGLPERSFDRVGNYTLGISDHTIFPETSDEELKNVFGISATLVTSAGSPEEADRLLRELGMPFASSS